MKEWQLEVAILLSFFPDDYRGDKDDSDDGGGDDQVIMTIIAMMLM